MHFKTLFTFALIPLAWLLAGCGDNAQPITAAPASQPSAPAAPLADSQKTGAQLWAENCARCHNMRSPQSFSSAQWQTIVMHMRSRADLTGPETRKITAFLQASH
ncbi:MAG TPA: hypothetical protein VFC78_13300 [Tepidisphaeraceae bacterium]|nr:hypothetical protein [Tepidisphaeraceae bacterium]